MRSLALLTFLIGTVLSSDVIDLSDSTFADQVLKKEIILVEFYAPWCGHCKRLAPEYETAATALLNNDPPVPLAKVDCTEAGKDSCSKHGVSGYPTLKVFRNGVASDYDGPRESAGIITYMRKQAGPSSVALKDRAHFDDKLNKADGNLIVGFFNSEDSFSKKFLKAADQQRENYMFAHTFDAEVAGEHANSIVMFRPKALHAKFEPTSYSFTNADASTLDIVKFYDDNALGMVGQLTKDNGDKFSKPTVTVYFKLDWKMDPKGGKYIRNRVARVAKKFVGKAAFSVAAKSDFQHKIDDWGFSVNDEVVVAAQNAKQQTFTMQEKWSVAALEKFTTDLLAGGLEPYIKSEPLPADNSGPVKVIVGKNFDEIVNDPTKDVLIEFYAPWCGHCKTLEPKYVELGQKLAGNKDIVIAKMDATANDPPANFEVRGFPTLYWSPMGSKENPKKYEGGRDVADFVSYIKREATNPVEVKDEL
jgi:protein disulfide isomerase family A protein 3